MKTRTDTGPMVINTRKRWLSVAWDAFILLALVYAIVASIGLRKQRDDYRAVALEAVTLLSKPQACPAPDAICPQWWFGSKDLGAAKRRICK